MTDADRFVDLACLCYGGDSRQRRADAAAMLAANPRLVDASARAAAAAGDVDALRAHAATDAALLALCYSRIEQRDALGCLELLLARGVDPNAYVTITDCKFTALTGVIGEGEDGPLEQPPHPSARAMAERLLDAGASPNDSQALYNTHFRPSNEWLELLLARGLTSDLDYQLGQAVKLGFGERVALLLAHGANADRRDFYNKQRHIDNAVREGHSEIVRMLRAAGAQPTDVAVSAPEALFAAARHGRLDDLRQALGQGAPIDGVDGDGLTALHYAARRAHLHVIQELLARGASRLIRDPVYGGTPLGHAQYFAARWPNAAWPQVLAALTPP